MTKETAQEQEFRIWGLSKLAVRNIVVFFILTLLSAIGALAKVIVVIEGKREATEKALIESKEQAAVKVEELKNENLQTFIKLHEVLQKQERIREELQETRETLKTIQKRIKR